MVDIGIATNIFTNIPEKSLLGSDEEALLVQQHRIKLSAKSKVKLIFNSNIWSKKIRIETK